MKKKLVSILAIAALLAQSSGVCAMDTARKMWRGTKTTASKVAATHREAAMMRGIRSAEAAQKWAQSPEFKKKAEYNEEVILQEIVAKFNLPPSDYRMYTLLNEEPAMIIMLTSVDAPQLTPQFMQAAKEAAKHSVWPELAKKVVAHFEARMEGNKEKIARAYKEANNFSREMSGTPIRK